MNSSNFLNQSMVHSNSSHIFTHYAFFTQASIIVLYIVYGIVFATGMIANLTILISMILHRQVQTRSIYLYTFNLAICDILILVFYIPTQMISIQDQLEWNMGEGMCKSVNIVLPVTLTCTIGILLAIACDRALGLLKPFGWKAHSLRRAKIAIPVIWFVSILINIPLLIYPKVDDTGPVIICTEGWPHHRDGELFWLGMFILAFCCPLVTLAATYVTMFGMIRKKSIRTNTTQETKMIKISVSLVAVFAVCTGFQHVFFFVTSSFFRANLSIEALHYLYVISNFFVTLQASVNPFIYGRLHEKCRCNKKRVTRFTSARAHLPVIRTRYMTGVDTVSFIQTQTKFRSMTLSTYEKNQNKDMIDLRKPLFELSSDKIKFND